MSLNENISQIFSTSEIIPSAGQGVVALQCRKYDLELINLLNRRGIENRPIISGNFLNQPAAKLYKFKQLAKNFPGAQKVQERGFFIGLHAKPITNQNLKLIVDSLLSF